MDFSSYFPIWGVLNEDQQAALERSAMRREVKKGVILHNGSLDCIGILLIRSGQLRAYILSDEGREVTIYRLFERDICLFSASCMMNSIQFDVIIESEKDSEVWIIPPDVYRRVMEQSAALSLSTNGIMASRFSDVIWLIEQIMWKSMDKRLAGFLLEEAALEGSDTLNLTHERIGNHMGTAREVITRMLRYFQTEGMVRLSRGTIEITAPQKLRELSEQ